MLLLLVVTAFLGGEGLLGIQGSREDIASCSILAQQTPLSQEA